MAPLKTVFHVHTDHSDDSCHSVERLLELARHAGIRCIAVTDHDTISGARELAAKAGADLRVIVGQEISTRHGHLIGLFLHEGVRPDMSVRQTAQAIKRQGGLVVVPHPFNTFFGCGIRDKVSDILDLIDIVEVCNAQNLLPFPNRKAEKLARQSGYPEIVGTDTHHGHSLDACYQLMEPFDGPAAFVESLKRATFVKGRHPLSYFVLSAQLVLRQKLCLPAAEGYGRKCTVRRTKSGVFPLPVRNE